MRLGPVRLVTDEGATAERFAPGELTPTFELPTGVKYEFALIWPPNRYRVWRVRDPFGNGLDWNSDGSFKQHLGGQTIRSGDV